MQTIVILCLWFAASVVSLPPAKFNHAYTGSLTIRYIDPYEIHKECRGFLTSQARIMACAKVRSDFLECTILVPNVTSGVITKPQQERLIKHELGHCNGWLSDHLGGIFTEYYQWMTMSQAG